MATFGWSDDNDSETEIVHDQSLTPQTKCDSEVGAETPNHVFQGKLRSIGDKGTSKAQGAVKVAPSRNVVEDDASIPNAHVPLNETRGAYIEPNNVEEPESPFKALERALSGSLQEASMFKRRGTFTGNHVGRKTSDEQSLVVEDADTIRNALSTSTLNVQGLEKIDDQSCFDMHYISHVGGQFDYSDLTKVPSQRNSVNNAVSNFDGPDNLDFESDECYQRDWRVPRKEGSRVWEPLDRGSDIRKEAGPQESRDLKRPQIGHGDFRQRENGYM